MKKGLVLGALISLLMISFCWANEDISKNPSCKYCGMDRQKFAHSRMLVEYDDGTVVGTCSLHCLGVDLALNLDKAPKGLRVGDFNTKNLIDAEKAFWIIGGDKPGVMTKRAKWAFEKKEDAESFIKAHGGKSVAFDEAIKASYEDIYEDTRMIRERRKMMKKRSMEHKH